MLDQTSMWEQERDDAFNPVAVPEPAPEPEQEEQPQEQPQEQEGK